jgi:hypothetical protein
MSVSTGDFLIVSTIAFMGLAGARNSPRPLDCGEEEMSFLGVFR